MNNIKEEIQQAALDIGFVDCGLTDNSWFPEYIHALQMRQTRFPEAASLYEPMQHRAYPAKGAPWVKSIVVCIRAYGKYRIPSVVDGHIGRNYLFDRRIPQCPDYALPERMEEVFRKKGIRFKRGGVPDRTAAARAGVAAIGRNGFAIHPTYGSWINIQSWRIDAPLPPDAPTWDSPCPDNCTACIDECPTGALCEPYLMRQDKCVAYLTYRAPRPIAEDLWSKMGPWIYGCDACQNVCPLNAGCWEEKERAEWLESVLPYLTPGALASMDEQTYRNLVHPLFWYIPADNLERWHANAQRACEACGMADKTGC